MFDDGEKEFFFFLKMKVFWLGCLSLSFLKNFIEDLFLLFIVAFVPLVKSGFEGFLYVWFDAFGGDE